MPVLATEFETKDGVKRIVKASPGEGAIKPRDKKTFLLLSGPNHNLFGTRKPEIYGTTTLADIEKDLTQKAKELGYDLICFQTNHEGEALDAIHYARCLAGVIINPGAWCHFSYALHDAYESVDVPVVEVHISNTYARESFRKSLTARVCSGYICGCGILGYELGLRCAINRVKEEKN